MNTNERGEGNSTAIVAIVVLVMFAIGIFFYLGPGSRPGEVNIQIEKKAEPPPEQPAANPNP
jgi:hypothetical protein